ncbi:hypothetical protein Patl1_31843 [Pistacia atlantica]|uniref:Uncharacterized protein n=1 Tax=Pistacia atlantica TaxID=434234 RepID=A0ACC1APP9_9ROSI|nr:hypothetical protein Patl1_31843 [Pistacia atlantica]
MKQGFTFSLPVNRRRFDHLLRIHYHCFHFHRPMVRSYFLSWHHERHRFHRRGSHVYVQLCCRYPSGSRARVPSNYMPDIEDDHNTMHEIKRKGGDLRYCQKCSHYKPPRAHHCRVCKRCVLRMDHHCIWISNCVGHANYKVFFVFLLYAVVACIYSLVLLVGSLSTDPLKDEQQSGGSFRTAYVISGLLLVPLSVALSVLLGWHIYLILQNKTTIEHHEGVRALWLAEKGGHVYMHPYDLGVYENLTIGKYLAPPPWVIDLRLGRPMWLDPFSMPRSVWLVLGPSIFSWVCPTSRHIGSGLQFRATYDNTAGASVLK